MRYFIGTHASARCNERRIDPRKVLEVVNSHAAEIARIGGIEVKVIIWSTSAHAVVAAVDPRNGCVKTVTYRRPEQMKAESYPVLGG